MYLGFTHQIEDSILVQYYVETDKRLLDVAKTLALVETTGKWFGGGKPTKLFLRCQGKVHEVHEEKRGKGIIELLLPLENLNLEKAPFTSLWLSMIGGAAFAMLDYRRSRLLDFSLPESALSFFPGPKFGLAGTRKILGAREDELLVGAIIKPTSGLTPKEVARICYELALGGVRFIKDDEKMLNPAYCPLAQRVKQVSDALRKAREETGEKVIYAPHISAGPERIGINAAIALENGASALMLNFFGSGFGALEMLARDKNIEVPIYAHCGGRDALTRAEHYGVDQVVIAKFARLLGADYFRVGVIGGYLFDPPQKMEEMTNVLRQTVPGIRDTVPVLSGGLDARKITANLKAFGFDVLALAGKGVIDHPMGTRAGVLSLKQAAEAYTLGIPVEQYAQDHQELWAVLRD